eukprot:4385515-Prymnesium_polylepis.1
MRCPGGSGGIRNTSIIVVIWNTWNTYSALRAVTGKARQRGISVLERRAEEQRIENEKEEARRPRAQGQARRSQSAPPKNRDKNGGEAARGRGRQRINEIGRRKEG